MIKNEKNVRGKSSEAERTKYQTYDFYYHRWIKTVQYLTAFDCLVLQTKNEVLTSETYSIELGGRVKLKTKM